LVEELVELVRPDAAALGCLPEVERALTIAAEGTSAERQLDAHERALAAGATPDEALAAVVDEVIADTLSGI
jgi:carboxylate-amine ligase